MISVSKQSRECEEDDQYNWGTCLDELFYRRKGYNFDFSHSYKSKTHYTFGGGAPLFFPWPLSENFSPKQFKIICKTSDQKDIAF